MDEARGRLHQSYLEAMLVVTQEKEVALQEKENAEQICLWHILYVTRYQYI